MIIVSEPISIAELRGFISDREIRNLNLERGYQYYKSPFYCITLFIYWFPDIRKD
jgi:hypothetical protein